MDVVLELRFLDSAKDRIHVCWYSGMTLIDTITSIKVTPSQSYFQDRGRQMIKIKTIAMVAVPEIFLQESQTIFRTADVPNNIHKDLEDTTSHNDITLGFSIRLRECSHG
jgi:hypothetical protein